MAALGADFYAFSGHKLRGPHRHRRALRSARGAGAARAVLRRERDHPRGLARPRDRGTISRGGSSRARLPIAGAIGLGAAIDYVEGLGREAVRRHDTELVGEALARLGEVEDLEIYGPRDPEIRAGVLSFNFPGVHPHDLSAALDAEGVAVRAGHHCAQPLMRRLGVAGTARASFFVHTGADDIAALAAALHRARELLGAGRLRPSTR